MASTFGGSKYGVAKSVTLHGVRVLGCAGSGTYGDIIAGMDWVTQQHVGNLGQKLVADISFGGGFSSSVNAAVERMVTARIVVAVAAGNDNGDACGNSPASAAVAATDQNDARASFSNFGSCVDIFAPGVGILGSWYDCNTCTRTISGTSMVSPHVAGVAALFLQNGSGSPNEILAAILAKAVDGIMADDKGSPNEFLKTTNAP